MRRNISTSEKWYKPYDPIVWVVLLVAFIGIIMYQENNSGYNYEEIHFNKDITTIKEAIDETNKIVKDKYGDKYKLYSITGFSSSLLNGTNIQPDLEISYLQVKGLSKKMIDYNVSLEDDKIIHTYVTASSPLDKEINFNYNPSKLDLAKIIDIVEKKVDMEKVQSGYEPYINFNAYDNDMNINIGYYKKMKNSGVDYESKVNYTFVVDLKTQKIKSESVEGINS